MFSEGMDMRLSEQHGCSIKTFVKAVGWIAEAMMI